MARTLREYVLEISPPWLQTPSGGAFMSALGEVKDSLFYRAREAVRIRFFRYASADALGRAGDERGLPRAAGESLEGYRARLRGAWAAWGYAGTALGLLRILHDTGYPNAHLVIFNGRRYSLDADRNLITVQLAAGSWKFRGLTDTYWSRFAVLFPQPLPAAWVAGGVPASSSGEAGLIRGLVRRWKPAHMSCEAIAIATSPETWGYFPAGGTWGDAGLWGDSTPWTIWTP